MAASSLAKRIAGALEKRQSGVFGGYSREESVESVCAHIRARFATSKTEQALKKIASLPKAETKKRKLTAFENFTDTTAVNRCSVLVVVPNIGMISELVTRILGGAKTRLSSAEPFVGDQGDDFLIGLKYVRNYSGLAEGEEGQGDGQGGDERPGRFEEASHLGADVVIATTKHLTMMKNKKVDVIRHGITTEDELEAFKRETKLALGVYSFLSGVDTTFFIDTDVLQLQNMRSVGSIVQIVRETRPTVNKQLNLKYLSSGEDQKQFILLTKSITREMLQLLDEFAPGYTVINQLKTTSKKPAEKGGVVGDGVEITLLANRQVADSGADPAGTARYLLAKHHIEAMLAKVAEIKLLVILRDAAEVAKLRAVFEGSIFLASELFFIDEHTARNRIKEQLKAGGRKVWVVTERFVFYRRTRLASLVRPFGATRIFAPAVPLPYTLAALLPVTEIMTTSLPDKETTSDLSYAAPITLVYNHHEQWAVSALTGQPFSPEAAFEYFDWASEVARVAPTRKEGSNRRE